MMRQTAVGFKSKRLTLEGVIALPEGVPPPYPAIVMCHPHPLLGGSMDNPVVTTVCRAACEAGIAGLRFNFRGVEGSEGEFGGESARPEDIHEDIKAALDLMRRWPGVNGKRITLAGYSFGAGAILLGMRRFKRARSLALIAPPLSALARSGIVKDKRPKLFIAGQNDRLTSSVELQRALDAVREPLRFCEIPHADHAMSGKEWEVADAVTDFVRQTSAQ